jgi:hypothetical protein
MHYKEKKDGMQHYSFYRFSSGRLFSGNAKAFLLPFLLRPAYLGQCKAVPFTVSPPYSSFRVMQLGSFYRFSSDRLFSGNATRFLLPFLLRTAHLGQCSPVPFTVFPQLALFGTIIKKIHAPTKNQIKNAGNRLRSVTNLRYV